MSVLERELKSAVEFIPHRLYYVTLSSPPPIGQNSQRHFFSIDNEFIYWNFYLDFGPLNLGHLYRFCNLLNTKLKDEKLKDKQIYYYSSSHPHKKANAAHLICSWALLYLDRSPEDAFRPFRGSPPFPSWHDATPTVCTFTLTILDTLKGLQKAREHRFFDFANFNAEEYEYYEKVEHGDLNWYVEGKFVAFAGPHSERDSQGAGYYALRPDDYVPYFKRKNVNLVVRLNKSYYDPKKFISQGIQHMDLYFIDGGNPPEPVLNKFISKCEEVSGAIAVHCKAGLGRTGTCVGLYIMKHYKMTAEETIGWLRIVRPGSVIGQQQQFMRDMQLKMWRDGDLYRTKLTSNMSLSPPMTHPNHTTGGSSSSSIGGSSSSNSMSGSNHGNVMNGGRSDSNSVHLRNKSVVNVSNSSLHSLNSQDKLRQDASMMTSNDALNRGVSRMTITTASNPSGSKGQSAYGTTPYAKSVSPSSILTNSNGISKGNGTGVYPSSNAKVSPSNGGMSTTSYDNNDAIEVEKDSQGDLLRIRRQQYLQQSTPSSLPTVMTKDLATTSPYFHANGKLTTTASVSPKAVNNSYNNSSSVVMTDKIKTSSKIKSSPTGFSSYLNSWGK